MVLQSLSIDYERFGFYSQAEHPFCKDTFLQNSQKLLTSNEPNHQLLPCEAFVAKQYIATGLTLLLAVNSPQQYQNLQRLLLWLGLQVQIVSHEAEQQVLWQTGQYNLLITEFTDSPFLEMTSKPLVDVGVFSLTDDMPHINVEDDPYFKNWSIGKLSHDSTLTELSDTLAPWLRQRQLVESAGAANDEHVPEDNTEYVEDLGEPVITEVARVFLENCANATAFDFSQYVQHQGTVELALFMLGDYTQENHQQLDNLIEAIKAKNISDAQLCISALTLNAKILSASQLQSLCIKWSKLLSGSEVPSSLEKINALLKETRIVLNEIDQYAEAI